MLLNSQDHAAIEKQNIQLTAAIGSGDIPAIFAVFSDDAVLLAPRRDIIKGPNIRNFWRNMAKQLQNVKFATLDLETLAADAVRETGYLTFQAGDQSSEPISCKYLLVWQKKGDDWKLAAMSWSRIVKAGLASEAS